MKLVRAVALAWLALAGATEESSGGGGSRVAKSTGPPAFFLQDPTDGLCLSGTEFKRCAIDTLWYVTGKPGSYLLHHRKLDEVEDVNKRHTRYGLRYDANRVCGGPALAPRPARDDPV